MTSGLVYPQLIGSDIGCGMALVRTRFHRRYCCLCFVDLFRWARARHFDKRVVRPSHLASAVWGMTCSERNHCAAEMPL